MSKTIKLIKKLVTPSPKGTSWKERKRTWTLFSFAALIILVLPPLHRTGHFPGIEYGDSEIKLVTNEEKIYVGQSFVVKAQLSAPNMNINAAQIRLEYNPHFLEIIKMTTEKSFCSFYAENNFDNNKGVVNLACGTPNPGFRGDSTLLELTFRSRLVGDQSIKFTPGEANILANDGKGTNILKKTDDLNINIVQSF